MPVSQKSLSYTIVFMIIGPCFTDPLFLIPEYPAHPILAVIPVHFLVANARLAEKLKRKLVKLLIKTGFGGKRRFLGVNFVNFETAIFPSPGLQSP